MLHGQAASCIEHDLLGWRANVTCAKHGLKPEVVEANPCNGHNSYGWEATCLCIQNTSSTMWVCQCAMTWCGGEPRHQNSFINNFACGSCSLSNCIFSKFLAPVWIHAGQQLIGIGIRTRRLGHQPQRPFHAPPSVIYIYIELYRYSTIYY